MFGATVNARDNFAADGQINLTTLLDQKPVAFDSQIKNDNADIILSDISGAYGQFAASGDAAFNRENQKFKIDLKSSELALATLTGNAALQGKVSGDLHADGTPQKLSADAHVKIENDKGQSEINLTGDYDSEQKSVNAAVDGSFDHSGDHFDLGAKIIGDAENWNIKNAQLTGPDFDFTGDAVVARDSNLADGQFKLKSGNLQSFGRLLGQVMSGQAAADFNLKNDGTRQQVSLTANAKNIDALKMQLQQLDIKANAADAWHLDGVDLNLGRA